MKIWHTAKLTQFSSKKPISFPPNRSMQQDIGNTMKPNKSAEECKQYWHWVTRPCRKVTELPWRFQTLHSGWWYVRAEHVSECQPLSPVAWLLVRQPEKNKSRSITYWSNTLIIIHSTHTIHVYNFTNKNKLLIKTSWSKLHLCISQVPIRFLSYRYISLFEIWLKKILNSLAN